MKLFKSANKNIVIDYLLFINFLCLLCVVTPGKIGRNYCENLLAVTFYIGNLPLLHIKYVYRYRYSFRPII